MIDKDAYDFVLSYRASNGEYEGSQFPNVKEFKLWVMEHVGFTKQELVDMMGRTAKCSNPDIVLAKQESKLRKYVRVYNLKGDMVTLTYVDGTSELMSREKMRMVVLDGYRYFNKEVCGE